MDTLYKIDDYELLNQKVYKILKLKIIKGKIKPGSKLSEVEVSKELGVSRTPVREALHKLAAEGFVKKNPNQGVTVNVISLKDTLEILQIRAVLEGLATRLAVNKISIKEIKELEKILEQMISSIKNKDKNSFVKVDRQFEDLILNACGNIQLKRTYNNLNDYSYKFRIKSLNIPGRFESSLKEHLNIVEALKKRDSEQSERLARLHVDNIVSNILLHEEKFKAL